MNAKNFKMPEMATKESTEVVCQHINRLPAVNNRFGGSTSPSAMPRFSDGNWWVNVNWEHAEQARKIFEDMTITQKI